MINLEWVNKYCCDDISLIENYDKASKDLLETWHLHHRKEEWYSMQDLKDLGLYYKRPASELIFLTKSEHLSLHNKGKKLSEEHRRKIGDAQKGEKNHMYGKHLSEEHKRKISEVLKETMNGENNPFYGKHHSDESKRKISEAKKGENNPFYGKHHSDESKRKISEAMKGNKNADFFKKQVIQLDKTTGEIIKIWPCAREVERVLGIAHNSISLCCAGKQKSAGGYIWRYALNATS